MSALWANVVVSVHAQANLWRPCAAAQLVTKLLCCSDLGKRERLLGLRNLILYCIALRPFWHQLFPLLKDAEGLSGERKEGFDCFEVHNV